MKVKDIKIKLLDVTNESELVQSPWTEGYLSALAGVGIISEDEFDGLIIWAKQTRKEY